MTTIEELKEIVLGQWYPPSVNEVCSKAANELVALTNEIEKVKEHEKWMVNGIKEEANGYHRDYMRCNKWCCENGYAESTDNAVDTVLSHIVTLQSSLTLSQAKVEEMREFIQHEYNKTLDRALSTEEHGRQNWMSKCLSTSGSQVLCLLLLMLLIGCSPEKPSVTIPHSTPAIKAEARPVERTREERLLDVIEIWHCDDGTFEVRTTYTSRGHYQTLEDAKITKTNWAVSTAAIFKAEDEALRRISDCGNRIE